jgi:hypothetical protein
MGMPLVRSIVMAFMAGYHRLEILSTIRVMQDPANMRQD